LKEKLLSFLLAVCLLLSVPMSASASEMGELESYGVRLIQYYLHHQDKAGDVIWDITRQMKELDPKQGAVWEKIMFDWAWINKDMVVFENALPDGLPQDDSLCIVVMGFGLNPDGSMREELEDRLVVALTSALKYPNAYVLVTGGQTGAVDGVTEAGQMSAWLQKKGLEKSRILEDHQSLSTTANAVNCYKLLTKSYPQVDSIAVVTSDYHIAQSCAMFAAVSNYQSGYRGGKSLELVGNGVCDTGLKEDSLAQQAWGISLIMGIPFDERAKAPALYPVEIPPDPSIPETEAAQEEPGWPILTPAPASGEETESEVPAAAPGTNVLVPTLAIAAAVVVLLLLRPRKPKKKNRREKPKMNWDV